MNAPLRIAEVPLRPRSSSRAARVAAERRRARTLRARYRIVLQIFAAAAGATMLVCAYLALLDNVARMDYQIAKVTALRSSLVDETSRNADTIARLESRERLAAVAGKLGMREPGTFVLVQLPDAPVVAQAPRGLAFLSWLVR